MAEWKAYYQNEDDYVDGEEGDEFEVDYKCTGHDSLVFLVDASKEMFIRGEDGEPSPFDMTMQCVCSVYTSKIISSDKDLVALVFYGTEQSKNPRNTFKHVYVYHDLDSPGMSPWLAVSVYVLKGFWNETMGSGKTNLGEALWCCSNLYSDVKLRLSYKRLMIFTSRTKAGDLKETGVVIDLMHLKPGGFDVSLFFCDVVSPPEDESELGLQMEPCGKLEDLRKRVRAKEMKRSMARLNLCLGEEMNVAVGVYITVRQTKKPNAKELYRDNNEPAHTKTCLYHTQTGSLLLPSDTKRAQVYAGRQIVMEKDEVDVIKKFSDPGLELIGFKPMERLKLHHHLRSALFIYPEEETVTGVFVWSACVFTALLRRCSERNVFALCNYTRIRNSSPRFLALVPQREELDEGQAQIEAPGFHGIFLPYADDICNLDAPQLPTASDLQVDKMKEIVHKLPFKFPVRSDAFENPVLQQHYRNLEALALDPMAPEHTEDHTVPKVKMNDQCLGSLAQEFKDLVYPADLEAEEAGGAEKKPKVEMSEDELRAHVQKGTLGKLTVPALKDACKQFGVKVTGTKKRELIDALKAQLAK
uniref:DNA helicase n=1 Tax=Oncorhynchus tshawytscha TaxID=74940 RepID=A0A8C8JR45_ONCTS